MIYSTDADAHLPDDYFEYSNLIDANCPALCFNFQHISDDKLLFNANYQYELALRYFVAGLLWAGSGYAFFTIGSVLAFSASAYAQVRGFPKRSAGEDFYLLNKIAKLGKVQFVKSCVVQLDARTSDRVPFGTGPAVEKIIQLSEGGQQFEYYHPEIFVHLKQVLVHFNCLYQYRNSMKNWQILLPIESQQALMALGFSGFIAKHNKCSMMQFNKQINIWFDGFKTLKFVHYLRDNFYPNLPIQQAIEQAPFSLAALSLDKNL